MEKGQVVPFPEGAASPQAVPQSPLSAELKAERVQEPAATLYAELKAERVQEPEALAAEEPVGAVLLCELRIHRPQAVTVELFASKVAVTFQGNPAVDDSGIAG